jgi:hypothetical protein
VTGFGTGSVVGSDGETVGDVAPVGRDRTPEDANRLVVSPAATRSVTGAGGRDDGGIGRAVV